MLLLSSPSDKIDRSQRQYLTLDNAYHSQDGDALEWWGHPNLKAADLAISVYFL